jgi:hypothetical protein
VFAGRDGAPTCLAEKIVIGGSLKFATPTTKHHEKKIQYVFAWLHAKKMAAEIAVCAFWWCLI